jgi:hypothetical protein
MEARNLAMPLTGLAVAGAIATGLWVGGVFDGEQVAAVTPVGATAAHPNSSQERAYQHGASAPLASGLEGEHKAQAPADRDGGGPGGYPWFEDDTSTQDSTLEHQSDLPPNHKQ